VTPAGRLARPEPSPRPTRFLPWRDPGSGSRLCRKISPISYSLSLLLALGLAAVWLGHRLGLGPGRRRLVRRRGFGSRRRLLRSPVFAAGLAFAAVVFVAVALVAVADLAAVAGLAAGFAGVTGFAAGSAAVAAALAAMAG